MSFFARLSLAKKLKVIIALTCGLALLVSAAAILFSNYLIARHGAVRKIEAIADIVGNNTSAAILFKDRQTAEELLASLSVQHQIRAARIVMPDGKLFARYVQDPRSVAAQDRPPLVLGIARDFIVDLLPERDRSVEIGRPILYDEKFLGTIKIGFALTDVEEQLAQGAIVLLSAILIAMAVAIAIADRMQRAVSEPILALSRATAKISRDRDYSLRVRRRTDDEVGKLVDGFNVMLEVVESTERGLKTAISRSEMASRAKSEFLANMSHELRTPLNAIIGFSEIMSLQVFGPLGSERYVGYVNDIARSATHLHKIINDILDLAKVEAGKVELAEEELNVAEAVESAIRLVEERARQKELSLTAEVPSSLPKLWADQRLVIQCLVNLLSNAVKFTHPGGSIELCASIAPGGSFEFQVADTGIGIAPENLEKVLAPFGQVEGAFARSHEGTGLGLPLVQSFMELHGGTLLIVSEPKQGTRVTLRFPASRVRHTLAAAKPQSAS
jgi:signal transduction histidine kinase